ncbi:MAG: response regulator transcription factor [Hydrogenophilales bacterium]|nr:response regulator transcription factor [Hydrogenophilales bacterium]
MSETPLRILIVDDEAPARRRLRDVLSDISAALPLTVVGEASNGKEAIAQLEASKPHVLLLDIRMPVMDGIETAEHLLKLEPAPAVIFTTAYDDYAIQAFEVNAIDYLLKPIRPERLIAALQKARALTHARMEALKGAAGKARTHISIGDRGRILLVPLADVVFLKAELKYVTVRTLEKEYLLEESLVKLEQEFTERFVRIHRNCLLARDYIEGFERVDHDPEEGEGAGSGWVARIRGMAERLPVSRRQQHIIKEFKR